VGLFEPIELVHHGLLLDAGGRFLARAGPDGWQLPKFQAKERHPADAGFLVDRFFDLTGARAHLLTRVSDRPGSPLPSRTYAFEVVEAGGLRPEWRWLAAREAGAPADAAAWEALSARPTSHPWTRPGFFAGADRWIRQAADRRSLAVRGYEQVRSWEFSSVLEVRLSSGAAAYFKALPGRYAAIEIGALQALSEVAPASIPPLLAVDVAEGRALLGGCQGTKLEQSRDRAAWIDAARAWARLQQAFARSGRNAGLPEHPPGAVAGDLEALVECSELHRAGLPGGLTAEELELLRASVPALREACSALAADGLPPMLDHGDLWASNVFVGAGPPVFIDWSDAELTHPFISVHPLIEGGLIEDAFPDDFAQVRAAMREAYLAEWSGELGAAAARRSYRHAEIAAPVFHAWRFFRSVWPHLQTQELKELVPFFFRGALAALRRPVVSVSR